MNRLAKLTFTELKLFLRDPTAVFFAVVFPPMLLGILGAIPAFREPSEDLGGQRVVDLYVPIMIGFVLAMLAISVLPTYLATYREKGILRRLSTTPVPPSSLLLAQLAMGVGMAVVAVTLVLGVGVVVFDIAMPEQLLGYLVAFVLAAAAIFAVGLLVAAVAPSGKAASGIGSILFFPMMFLAGLYFPREVMPEVLRRIGDFTPLGAGVQALQDATTGAWPQPLHLAVLAVFAIAASLTAAKLFRWECGSRMDERPSPSDGRAWERRFEKVLEVLPHALLAGSAVLSLIQPGQTSGERLATAGLVALAAAWVLSMYTLRPPRWRERTGPMAVYFAGMLTLAAVLTTRSWFFVAFAVTGLVQAFFLLPTVLAFIGVAATSMVIYTAPGGFPEPTVEAVSGWIFIICLQTVLTGFFSYMGMKLMGEDRQRRELLVRLEAAMEENAGLHAQLLTQAREAGVLDERQRMAREIHDTLAQGLTGIITQLEATERASRRPEHWRRHLDQARALARDSLTEARRSVQALRPEPLEDAGLPDAIAHLAERWSETTGVVSSVETTGEPRPLLAELEMTLFRVAQEALANVGKHPNASKVGLTLSYMDDAVLLDVRDDGAGFTAGPGGADGRRATGQGFGLDAMRQRLRRVAGSLEIESAPGEGTAVNARVPAISAEASG